MESGRYFGCEYRRFPFLVYSGDRKLKPEIRPWFTVKGEIFLIGYVGMCGPRGYGFSTVLS